jgi:hypothetical protein
MKHRYHNHIITTILLLISAFMIACEISAEELLEGPLPPTAKVLVVSDQAGMFGGVYYTVIEMSEADYKQLVKRMGMVHRADLLDFWSFALSGPENVDWWKVSSINDANTVFSDKKDSTYLVARYEDGKMYFKVYVY